MASAQLAEEELQQSVVVSEEDMERDDVASYDGRDQLPTASPSHSIEGSSGSSLHNWEAEVEACAGSSQGASPQTTKHGMEEQEADEEEDADGEFDDAIDLGDERSKRLSSTCGPEAPPGGWLGNGTGAREESLTTTTDSSSSVADGEDEAVGAVKIRPGETDDDEASHDSESDESSDGDGTEDTDSAAAWEDAREEDGEGDDDSEAIASSNLCIFCKQDEEHDPGEEFEEFLECPNCGENAHQYCVREAKAAVQEPISSFNWTCPGCPSSDGSTGGDDEDHKNNSLELRPGSSRVEPLVDTTKQAQGPRGVRKRKSSPADGEETLMLLRKRHRKASGDLDPSSAPSSAPNESRDVPDSDQSRKLRLKAPQKYPTVSLLRRPQSMIIKIRVSPERLQEIMAPRALFNRKRGSRSEGPRPGLGRVPHLPMPFLSSAVQPFYSFVDREADEIKSKPYGGILNDTDADTTKTLPATEDRRRFDEAKQKAEEEWRILHAADSAMERSEQRKKPKKSGGPASQIECIEFGGWEIDTWYAAPYPEEYSRNRILYICEFCLKYMNSDYVAWRHKLKCPAKHPPGDEIYRHGSVSVFEVDGRKNPVFCQNLCLLAKLFLGSKTLYYDVEPFLFYVLCEHDDLGYHFVGYFSKEKRASSQNNVSCILTLPIHQRKGYGNLLIDFSYLLTRVEQKTGSPEKPLSDMGLVSYRNYWRLVMCQYLLSQWTHGREDVPSGLSIRRISDDTGLTPDDVISALEGLRCLARDHQTGLYAFRVDLGYCREYLSKWEAKNYVKLNQDALTWTPYVMGRGNATNFELGPAISAIAPREEDEDRRASLVASRSLPSSSGLRKLDMISIDDVPGPADIGQKETSKEMSPTDTRGLTHHDIRQSTEPSELAVVACPESTYSIGRNSDEPETVAGRKHWASAYQDIPPTRFEVYPALTGRRNDRPRNPVPRPPIPRPSSHTTRQRRSGGNSSSRRPAASRPKSSSSSRRKTGGTGRGPGRWPKGTKKSDYGNASSGPGLPPAWIKERQRLAAGIKPGKDGEVSMTANMSTAMDSVRVQFDEAMAAADGEEHLPREGAPTNGAAVSPS